MFHYTPQSYSAPSVTPNNFHSHQPSSCTCHHQHHPEPSFDDFAAFDARRSHLEQVALAQRQQERRQAEEAQYYRQQQLEKEQAIRVLVKQEVQRRRRAAVEEQARKQLEAQQQWIAPRNRYLKQQQLEQQQLEQQQQRERAAAIEEHNRRIVAARQQQAASRHHHQQQQQQIEDPFQLIFHQILNGLASLTADDAESTPPKPEPATSISTFASVHQAPSSAAAPTATAPTAQELNSSPLADHHRAQVNRVRALTTLTTLASSLESRQSTFVPPTTLTFQPSPPPSTSSASEDNTTTTSAPKLAFQPANGAFLSYEDFLVTLLSKVDEVQSGGDRLVKRARKELVKRIDRELAQLDEVREKQWEKQSASEEKEPEDASTAAEVTPATVDTPTKAEEDDDEPLAPLLDDDIVPYTVPESSTTEESTPASLDSTAPANTTSPLTTDAVAALPSHDDQPSTRSRRTSISSDTVSTLSVDSLHLKDDVLQDVVQQAKDLGAEVTKLEEKERAEEDQEEFVVV